MYFDYSKIDVEDYLNELGLNNISRKGDQVWFSCPLSGHLGADKTPSASMELGTTRMHCFGCNFSGNAVSFLSELEGVSPLKARKWLRERFNIGYYEPEEGFASAIHKKLERMQKRLTDGARSKQIHSTLLDEREVTKRTVDWRKVWSDWEGKIEEAYPLAYMLDRGFHPTTLDKWAIGWDMISQRISIPIRDEHSNLVGFKGRSVNNLPRYLVLGGPEYGFDTYNVSNVLFGLDKVKEDELYHKHGGLIVVEGELNCIAMHQKGYTCTVGISGKILSDKQINLIKKHANTVLYIFDEVKDTENAARTTNKSIYTYMARPHSTDPADMSEEELHELVAGARSAVLL
jgi:DNA primase